MQTIVPWLKKHRLMCAVAALAALLIFFFNRPIEWKEEVQLQSGEIILVKRTAKTKAFGEIGGPGGWENEGMTVEVVKPLNSENPPKWEFPFVPLVFDRDTNTKQWFMVATFYSCQSWVALGKPALPYTEYRVINGKWVQQALSKELIGRQANMLTSIRSSGEPDHTLRSKAAADSDVRIAPKFRRVVEHFSSNC